MAAPRRLADRYELTGRIAVGGMGEVWRGRDDVLDRTVAVKLLRPEFADDGHYLQRFRAEARHAAALSHPGIASVYDYGEAEGRPFLVMEYVPGDSLAALLARAGGALSVTQALDIVGQAALGVHAAHEAGIVHRDIKPANLLVRPDGLVKVTDFGIARPTDDAGPTRTPQAGEVVEGTAYYIAPEQVAGQPATPASDIYALGVVAYEALAGRHAFDGPDPGAVAAARLQHDPAPLPAEVPPGVRELVTRSLDRDPARRPASAADLGRSALALAHADPPRVATAATQAVPTDPAPTRTLPVSSGPPAEQRRVRNRLLLAGALVVLAGIALMWLVTALSSGPQLVTITRSDYLGKPASVVEKALRGLKVKVAQRTVPSRAPAGTVLQVSPSGRVAVGSTVTVTVGMTPAPTPTAAAPTATVPPAGPAAKPAPPPGPPPGHGGGKPGKDH